MMTTKDKVTTCFLHALNFFPLFLLIISNTTIWKFFFFIISLLSLPTCFYAAFFGNVPSKLIMIFLFILYICKSLTRSWYFPSIHFLSFTLYSTEMASFIFSQICLLCLQCLHLVYTVGYSELLNAQYSIDFYVFYSLGNLLICAYIIGQNRPIPTRWHFFYFLAAYIYSYTLSEGIYM